jgi:alpha-1,3-mannosyltransferase
MTRSPIASLNCSLIHQLTSKMMLPLPYFLGTRAHTFAYITSAFDLSREFLYKWTVNWRMMSGDRFLSRRTALGLLATHVSTSQARELCTMRVQSYG